MDTFFFLSWASDIHPTIFGKRRRKKKRKRKRKGVRVGRDFQGLFLNPLLPHPSLSPSFPLDLQPDFMVVVAANSERGEEEEEEEEKEEVLRCLSLDAVENGHCGLECLVN